MAQKKKKRNWLRVIADSVLDPQDWWFWIGFILALACITMFLLIFLWPDEFKLVSFGPWLYISYLGGYTTTKEIGSWEFKKRVVKRPGDLIVFLWVLFGIILWWWAFLDKARQVPERLDVTISMVIGIFALGRASRAVRSRVLKNQEKDKTESKE